jgi:hypothetical protein
MSEDAPKAPPEPARDRRAATAEPARRRGGAAAEDPRRDPGRAAGPAGRLHHERCARQGDLHRQGRPSCATACGSTFQPASGDSRDFVPLLEGIVADIETVVTSNEKEALLLENTLIKRHQPRFNVNLKDDKNFLVLRLDPKAEWPRLEGGAQAGRRRRPLLRPVPFGDLVPRDAAGR